MDAADTFRLATAAAGKGIILNDKADFSNLSIVIPAFNEEKGVGVTLDGLLERFVGAEIIVVDDCSGDGTSAEVLKRSGIRLLRHSYNRGQGASLKTGMRVATRTWVAWFDADNELRSEDLLRLVERARKEDVLAVIGQRTSQSATITRGVGKALIRALGRSLNMDAGKDANCGLRLFRRDAILAYLPLIPDRFSASLVTTLIFLERRYPIAFESVSTNPRLGTSTVRMKDGLEAILVLIRASLLFAPLRVFLPLGLWTIGIGLAYSLIIAFWFGSGLPVGGSLLSLIGLLTVMLGLIADQISQMRLSQFNNASSPMNGVVEVMRGDA
jgi:glycosyltransferase involved in cell wall biosynthesis